MAGQLEGKRIAFLVADEGIEQVELTEPWKRAKDEGAEVVLISPGGGKVQAMNHLDKGDTFDSDTSLVGVKAVDFDALVLPGGVANPDQLRMEPAAVGFAGDFVRQGRPVAVICHGPWTLVEAGVVRGRTLTSWPSLRTDIQNAGGSWVDKSVVVCTEGPGPIISSRKPDDLPDFCDQMVVAVGGSVRPGEPQS